MTGMATTDAQTISRNLHHALGFRSNIPGCERACAHVVSGEWTIGGIANVLARVSRPRTPGIGEDATPRVTIRRYLSDDPPDDWALLDNMDAEDLRDVAKECLRRLVAAKAPVLETEVVTPADAVAVLNRVHAVDPKVMPALISTRVRCNKAVRDDPTVQVEAHRADGSLVGSGPALGPNSGVRMDDVADHYEVGFLGILNGIFGVNADGQGHIGAQFTSVGGRLVEFKVNDGS